MDGDDPRRERESAVDRRESLPPGERERVERRVAELLDLLGRAYAMAVLREFALAEGPLRYSDLSSALDVSPSTLSERLADLVDAGLLVREAYDEVPPRVEYHPTAKAEALFPAFGHLHRWATEHALEPVADADAADGGDA